MRLTLVTLVTLASATWAAPRSPPKPAAVTPAPAPTGPKASETPTPALFNRAVQTYASLAYDEVIPIAEELLKRSDLAIEQQLETYRLYGCAKAIVRDPIEAEKPFRQL